MNKNIRQVVLPLVASFIWGYAFIFQKQATEANIPAFAYNASRSLVAAIVLGFIIIIKRLLEKKNVIPAFDRSKGYIKHLLIGGLLCGTFLTAAVNLQQVGIAENAAGKAGFLTALYIVIVPLLTELLHIVDGGMTYDYVGLYIYNALSISGIMFWLYAVGVRPFTHRLYLTSPKEKALDKVEKVSNFVNSLIYIAIFLFAHIVYAIIYFKG